MAARPAKQIKAVAYVGIRTSAGELTNVRKWDDIPEDEQREISRKLQIQCAKALGYVLDEGEDDEEDEEKNKGKNS